MRIKEEEEEESKLDVPFFKKKVLKPKRSGTIKHSGVSQHPKNSEEESDQESNGPRVKYSKEYEEFYRFSKNLEHEAMEELYDLHPDPVDPNTRIKKKKKWK